MQFSLTNIDGRARAGILRTDSGEVPTPFFMPVGTQGVVKAVEQRELEAMGAQILLSNTYHLYLRPGAELIEKAGGLHRFMNWERPILTDSGGYQVFSLSDLRGIDDDGVTFKSHIDGTQHRFTPERVVNIQRSLGSDIMMVLDECAPYPCDEEYARRSNELTIKWAERSKRQFQRTHPKYQKNQTLFGIVQGSIYPEVRRVSARQVVEMDFEGYAIGGLSVGEPTASMYEMVDVCTEILPVEKPRYLMGVGTPENILEAIERGIDMFDCVLPTRNGRNAMFFTRKGRVNVRNAGYADDFSPIDESCECYACRKFTRAYLRHLFKAREIMALQLASIHNLTFYLWLCRSAREAIQVGSYASWKATFLKEMATEAEALS